MGKSYIVELPEISDEDTDRSLKELEKFYRDHDLSQEEKDFLYKAYAALFIFQVTNDGKIVV